MEHVKWIMQRLLKAGLYFKPEKCALHEETVRFLALIRSTNGMSLHDDEVEMVWNWSREKMTKNGRQNDIFQVHQ